MLDLIAAQPLVFLLALLIGLVTGWWVWGDLPSVDREDDYVGEHGEPQAFAPPEDEGIDPEPAAPAMLASEGMPNIAAARGESEDLTLINGIGPKLALLLDDLGVRRFDQIAAWDADDVAEVDAHLGSFRGRATRDQWIEQAKLIAKGDMQTWKGRFGYGRK